jgi:hypothetical protein
MATKAPPKDGIQRKNILIVFPVDVEERLRAFLHNPSKGYADRGSLSKFVVESIIKELDRIESTTLENTNG